MKAQDMADRQSFLTAGGLDNDETDSAWSVTANAVGHQHQFCADHEEGDTRVWFHARHFRKVVIYSPDTDTFLIGLPLISRYGLSAVVRVEPPGAKDRLVVDVNKLLDSIKRVPDLAMIPEERRASAIAATYIALGCDYTSFFAGVGKAPFLGVYSAMQASYMAQVRVCMSQQQAAFRHSYT